MLNWSNTGDLADIAFQKQEGASMNKIIDFNDHSKKNRNLAIIDKLCKTDKGKYCLLGYIIGILKVQQEDILLIKKLYNSLDDKNKSLVLAYANDELCKMRLV